MNEHLAVDCYACNQCGARLYQPYCMTCEHRGRPYHDVRPIKVRRLAPAGPRQCPSHETCGLKVPIPSDLVRDMVPADQARYALACLRMRPPRMLATGWQFFLESCREAGWRGQEPWTAILWCLRRRCNSCGESLVYLSQWLSGWSAGRVEWLRIPRSHLCEAKCRSDDIGADCDQVGIAARTAAIRELKKLRGEPKHE